MTPHDDAIRRHRLFGKPIRIGDAPEIPAAKTADDEWMRACVTIEILRESGIHDRGELNACVCALHDVTEKNADRLTASSGVARKITNEAELWLDWLDADELRHAAYITELLAACEPTLREHRQKFLTKNQKFLTKILRDDAADVP